MTKNNNTNVILATLDNGKVLPLRQAVHETTNKKGVTSTEIVWAVLDYREDGTRFFNGWGVNADSDFVGTTMPTTVTILGETFKLTPDLNKQERPRVQAEKGAVVNVPGHGLKRFALRITVMGKSQFSLAAQVKGDGSVKPKSGPAQDKYKSVF